jgi:hypothetical protein
VAPEVLDLVASRHSGIAALDERRHPGIAAS